VALGNFASSAFARAAALAISERRAGVSAAALAVPPAAFPVGFLVAIIFLQESRWLNSSMQKSICKQFYVLCLHFIF
jgi:hypothetical protein